MRSDQKVMYDPVNQAIDVTGCEDLEIQIRWDGKVLWINDKDRCLLRVCQIKGKIEIKDQRDALKSSDAQVQTRKTPFGLEERAEGQKSQTGDSHNAERKT